MALIKCFLLLIICVLELKGIYGHGTVMDPVGRSSAWRKGYEIPKNYNDYELFCGGIGVQNNENGGKCGVCGDNYAMSRPRPNENGGTYGTGTIVKTYKAGQKFTTTLYITANHEGYFQFSLCPLSNPKELETEECFDKHSIKLANGSDQYQLDPEVKGDLKIELKLPADLTCEHCVFRWHWKTANNWGKCEDGSQAIGCGPHEHYRSCSDITIE